MSQLIRLLLTSLLAALLSACGGGGDARRATLDAAGSRPVLRADAPTVREGDEGERVLRFRFTLSGAPDGTAAVTVRLAGGSATAGSDFRAPPATRLEFPPGVTTQTLDVTVLGDRELETDETIVLALQAASDRLALASDTVTGRILDDDRNYLNDTGITRCADASRNDRPCPVAGLPRQDAEQGHDPGAADANGHAGFRFTKLDAAGRPLPADASEWACVRDERTGLVWEAKQAEPGLHYRLDRYSWYRPDGPNGGLAGTAQHGHDEKCSGYDAADPATWCNSAAFVARVNAEGLCGFTDWRVPSRFELLNLVDLSHAPPGPTIDTAFFPATANGPYWSATPATDPATQAWNVDFWDGDSNTDVKDNLAYLRLVRGVDTSRIGSTDPVCRDDIATASGTGRYRIHNDGTVTDLRTGLMWKRCPEGRSGAQCEQGTWAEMTWSGALAAAAASRFAGHDDWRLPNVKELASLLAADCASPAINATVFPHTYIGKYWSASPSREQAGSAWWVNFFMGRTGFEPMDRLLQVRLVRDTPLSD